MLPLAAFLGLSPQAFEMIADGVVFGYFAATPIFGNFILTMHFAHEAALALMAVS